MKGIFVVFLWTNFVYTQTNRALINPVDAFYGQFVPSVKIKNPIYR